MQSQRYFEREREPEETEGLKTEENRGRERQPEMEINTNPEASRVGETRGARGEAPGEAEREERRGGGLQSVTAQRRQRLLRAGITLPPRLSLAS